MILLLLSADDDDDAIERGTSPATADTLEFLGRTLPMVLRKIRLMEDTLGTDSRGQTPSNSNFSRISQAKRELLHSLYSRILAITTGVETRGLLPPVDSNDRFRFQEQQRITTGFFQKKRDKNTTSHLLPIAPGRIDPVSAKRASILLTHP